MNMMKQKTNFAGLVKRVTCLICGICFCFGIYAQQQKPFVIPELKEWKGATGFFMPKQSVRIIYGAPGLQKIARQFAADYKALFGVLPEIAEGKPCKGDFFFTIKRDKKLEKEGYDIVIGDYVKVSANEPVGVYWATRTLLQMGEQYKNGNLPKGHIRDWPDYGIRGLLIDCGRKFIPMNYLCDLACIMSYYKMNFMHVVLNNNGFKAYFNDDWNQTYAAFRLECETYPGLTARDGYYTKKEFVHFQEEAAERFVEIIPEIDLPGHSRNIASVHPEIRCNYPPDTVSTNGYDYRSAWCVAREENYALLGDILGELCELFPSEYIHVGGDEVDMSQWERCPDCRALMKREGMTDPHRLEDLFMERMAAILRSHGKRPAVWNEAVRTGAFARECRVHGWESVKACLDATAKGYRTVVMPGQYFYFDMRQSPREDGHDWAAIFDAKKVYGFGFTEFSPEQMRNVEGLQGAFFSEAYVSHEPEKPDYLDYMLFPRVCALARIAWSGNAEGWDAYYEELKGKHYDRMAAMGIRFRLFPPKVGYGDGAFTASADDGSAIYYLMDGSPEEHPYTAPVRTGKPHLYRFYSRYGTARSPYVADKSRWRTITPAVAITTSMGESAKFPYANAESYKGLSRTRRACRQQDWIRYTFSEPVRCREMYLQTGNRQLPKTIVTTGYAEVSYDGATFERAGELEMGSITLRPGRPVKAVRIVSTCDDNGTPYVTIQPPQVKPAL